MTTGGCACGGVRYRIDGPLYDTGWCHCRVCQLMSGAPALVFTTCALTNFVVERGSALLTSYRSTPRGERQHCVRCGTTLTIHVDFQPDEIDVAAATLDDPAAVTPGFHIFCEDAIAWAAPADDLPRYDRFRPDTRGLSS
jgi:hypothetical protein